MSQDPGGNTKPPCKLLVICGPTGPRTEAILNHHANFWLSAVPGPSIEAVLNQVENKNITVDKHCTSRAPIYHLARAWIINMSG